MKQEPKIQINDHVLTEAQATAVRVAISAFYTEVSDPEFAKDLGPISKSYKDRLSEVFKIMVREHK